jgi:hypothetical protein
MDSYVNWMAQIYKVHPDVFRRYRKEYGDVDIHILMNDTKKNYEFKERLKKISQYRYFKLKKICTKLETK